MLNTEQMQCYRQMRADGHGPEYARNFARGDYNRTPAVDLDWDGDESAEGTVTIEGAEYTVKVEVKPDEDFYGYDRDGKETDSLHYHVNLPDLKYLPKGLPLSREEMRFFRRHDKAILSASERAYRARHHEASSSYTRRMARNEWGLYYLPENDWREDWLSYRRHGMARHEAFLKAYKHALDEADLYAHRSDYVEAYGVVATVYDADGAEVAGDAVWGCVVDWRDRREASSYLRETGEEVAEEAIAQARRDREEAIRRREAALAVL